MGILSIFRTEKANREKIECPYCKGALNVKPSQKKKCPNCGKYIFIKKSPETEKKILVTEQEAKRLDRVWKDIYFSRKWLRNLSQYGITGKEYQTKKEQLTKRFGKEADSHDIIWGLFNGLIVKTRDLFELKMIYYQMAIYLNEEGKDSFQTLQQSSKMELLNQKQMGVGKVEIFTSGEASCPSCRKLHGKIYTIVDALKEMPIPCKDCSHQLEEDKKPFCRCMYQSVIDGSWRINN